MVAAEADAEKVGDTANSSSLNREKSFQHSQVSRAAFMRTCRHMPRRFASEGRCKSWRASCRLVLSTLDLPVFYHDRSADMTVGDANKDTMPAAQHPREKPPPSGSKETKKPLHQAHKVFSAIARHSSRPNPPSVSAGGQGKCNLTAPALPVPVLITTIDQQATLKSSANKVTKRAGKPTSTSAISLNEKGKAYIEDAIASTEDVSTVAESE